MVLRGLTQIGSTTGTLSLDGDAEYQAGSGTQYPAMAQYGTYTGPEQTIWISDDISYDIDDGIKKFRIAGALRTGIDLFANVVLHEAKHRSDYGSFRQITIDGYPNDKWDFNQGANNNHWEGNYDWDNDNDDVPNNEEHSTLNPPWPKTSRYKNFTWYNQHDNEFRAQLTETVAEDTNESIDWTEDGKQW